MRRIATGMERMDSLPRILLMPGLGAICAARMLRRRHRTGYRRSHSGGQMQRDPWEPIPGLRKAIASIWNIAAFSMQNSAPHELLLGREVALITGAAGAIGSGIAMELLEQGCHVALTDLPGENLDGLVEELRLDHGYHVMGAELDVTDPGSVACLQHRCTARGAEWISSSQTQEWPTYLRSMEMSSILSAGWRRSTLREPLSFLPKPAATSELQKTGGDIVMVSTKNVFAPGAKFGAYSATKSAAHQLARIASLEFAEHGVRVNMVSPDAVFAHGNRKSGLWATVGPDRMTARGLSAEGLEEYYRNRNLLKARVTATACRQCCALLRHQADAHDRSNDSRGRRPARRHAPIGLSRGSLRAARLC